MRAAQLRLQLWQGALDSISARVAILDAQGEIIAANAAWQRSGPGHEQTVAKARVGANYLSACEHAAGADSSEGHRAAQAIRDVLSSRRREVAFAYSGCGRGKKSWLLFRATKFEGPEPGRIMVAHESIPTPKAAGPRKTRAGRGEALDAEGNRILGLIGSKASLETVLHGVALLVESQRPDTCCAVVLLRNGRAEVAAAPNFSPGLLLELEAKADWTLTVGDSMLPSLLDLAQAVESEPGDSSFRFVPIKTRPGEAAGSLVTAYPAGAPAPDTAVLERAAALVAIAVDRAGMHERLSFQAQHDSLTQLPNRLLFQDWLQKELFRNRREGQPFAVLVVGLDRFQGVNDAYGYGFGDVALREVAQRIQGCMRPGDMVARLGGDQFIGILASVGSGKDADAVGHRIVEAFRAPFCIGKQSIELTCSVGISQYPQDATEPGTLIHYASGALAEAKSGGGNSCKRYHPQDTYPARPGGAACERTTMERYLSEAARSGELDLEYQPQVDRQRRVVGLEALMRWNSPALGRISPAEFIPLAEQSELIVEMGAWALRRACRQCVEWRAAGLSKVRIAVNVSTVQLSRPDFVAVVAAVLAETGMDPQFLELEITESGRIHAMHDAIRKMRELRKLGIHISVDDFGSGYSSLSYMQDLPIDTIKIDQSVIQPLDGDSGSAKSLVQSIIALAHNLQLTVVAEGIETEAQFETLAKLRCDVIQGFLLHRPLSVRNVERLLRPADSCVEADAVIQ